MLAANPIFCIQDLVQYKISAKLTEIGLETNSIENMGHGNCTKIELYSIQNCTQILFPFDFTNNFHKTNRVIGSFENFVISFCVFFLYRLLYILYFQIRLFRLVYMNNLSKCNGAISIPILVVKVKNYKAVWNAFGHCRASLSQSEGAWPKGGSTGTEEFDTAPSEPYRHCALLFAIVSLSVATSSRSDDCGIVFSLRTTRGKFC